MKVKWLQVSVLMMTVLISVIHGFPDGNGREFIFFRNYRIYTEFIIRHKRLCLKLCQHVPLFVGIMDCKTWLFNND